MEQNLEWLEAQKIEISIDLFAAAKQHLQFLRVVDQNQWLYDGPAVESAIYRYNAYWLPLLAKYTESSLMYEGPLHGYKSHCEEFYGSVLDNSSVVSSVNGNSKSHTEAIWKSMYPMESYDLDLDKAISEPKDISALEKCATYDLVSAVKRQSSFYSEVTKAHVDTDMSIQEGVARYKAFLYLMMRNREKSIKPFNVPTFDIDLICHTHHRSKGNKLETGFSITTAQWEETFGQRYCEAGKRVCARSMRICLAAPAKKSGGYGNKMNNDDNYENAPLG